MRWLIVISFGVFLAILPASAQTAKGRIAFTSYERSGQDRHTTVQVYDFDSQALTDVGNKQFDLVSDLTWSVDGRLAFVGRKNFSDYSVLVWSGELITIAQGAARYSDMTWSADGRLAFVGWRSEEGSDVLMWDGETLNTICTLPNTCSQPAWSVDGRLAFTSPDGAVYNFPCGDCDPPPEDPSGIVAWNQGEWVAVVDPLTTDSSARSPRWLDDGRLLFTLKDGGRSTLTTWDGDALTPLRPAPTGAYYWSTDGNLAVVSSFGAGMIDVAVIYDALTDSAAPSTSVVEERGIVDDPTWSHDGRLAFASEIDGDYGVFV